MMSSKLLLQTTRNAVARSNAQRQLILNINKRSMMTFGEKAALKEKFEEDRYMKQQEEAWKAKLKALKEQEEKDRIATHQAEVVDPVKADIAALLAKTGDKVSDEGLEALAKFRLDL